MSLRRFTNVKNLRGLGRPLLQEFFDRFEAELGACQATLPPATLENDDDYFKKLAEVFFSPKELPQPMTDVLEAVIELADDQGVAELTTAAKEQKLAVDWTKKRTNLDIVLEVWLRDAGLMMRVHNEHRLVRTTRFMYWATKTPAAQRLAFTPPTGEELECMRKAVDAWCRENHRGEDTVRITAHALDGEWWFLIQHGGTMARLAEAKGNQKTETLFYRPGKDDVVVYNAARDELRIHAGSKAEWELYRREFGQRLRGDAAYFSERKNFVLEPLRADAARALDATGVAGITRITLQEVEVAFGGEFDDRRLGRLGERGRDHRGSALRVEGIGGHQGVAAGLQSGPTGIQPAPLLEGRLHVGEIEPVVRGETGELTVDERGYGVVGVRAERSGVGEIAHWSL